VFALKKLKGIKESNGEKTADFLREKNALSRVSGTHLHFISLLATWSYRGEHCLLFPFADGDLRDYWENMSHAIYWQGSREAIVETVRWMSSQILGLTDALNALHSPVDLPNGLCGRHGDIKPENILIFSKGREDRGLLVFTDPYSSQQIRGEGVGNDDHAHVSASRVRHEERNCFSIVRHLVVWLSSSRIRVLGYWRRYTTQRVQRIPID
jgi:serine/threonine protein kinase